MLAAPDYGIPDVSETLHSFPHAIASMARAIAYTIRQYEPRLTNVRVLHVPSDTTELVLRYEVTAHFESGDGAVSFQTTIDPSRRVTVT